MKKSNKEILEQIAYLYDLRFALNDAKHTRRNGSERRNTKCERKLGDIKHDVNKLRMVLEGIISIDEAKLRIEWNVSSVLDKILWGGK